MFSMLKSTGLISFSKNNKNYNYSDSSSSSSTNVPHDQINLLKCHRALQMHKKSIYYKKDDWKLAKPHSTVALKWTVLIKEHLKCGI